VQLVQRPHMLALRAWRGAAIKPRGALGSGRPRPTAAVHRVNTDTDGCVRMPLCRHSHNGARNHCRDGSSVEAVAYRWKATGHNAPSFVRGPRLRGGMAGLDHETLNSDPLYSDRAMERAASAKSMRRVRCCAGFRMPA
jgi:hypothetical protein